MTLKKILAEGEAWLDLPPVVRQTRTGYDIIARLEDTVTFHHKEDPRWSRLIGVMQKIEEEIEYMIENGLDDDAIESDAIRSLPRDESWDIADDHLATANEE